MKCLLVTSYFPPTIGGSSTVYGNLFKYGQPNLSVLVPRNDRETGQPIDRKPECGVHSTHYVQPPQKRSRNLLHSLWILLSHDIPIQVQVLIKTLSIIRSSRIDVVCIGEIQALGWLGSILRRLTRTSIVYYAHGEELTTRSTSRFIGRKTRQHLARADGIICVSSYTASVLADQYNVPPAKIKLITNGIDLESFKPPQTGADNHDKEKPFTLFSAGRLIDRKGFDFAIRAVQRVIQQGYQVQLIIAGDGPQHDNYANLIRENSLQNQVRLLGRVSQQELVRLYQQCDCFIMPNRQLDNGDTEGFGLVFLEANLFRKPVIGGNAGGAIDAIQHEQTGLLVESTSVEAISQAIIRLANDPALRNRLADNGYQWALQNDVKHKVDEFIDYCRNLSSHS